MTRQECTTQKVDREVSGLNGSLFVHVEFDGQGRPCGVQFSHRWKDGSTLDGILHALAEATTAIIARDSEAAL